MSVDRPADRAGTLGGDSGLDELYQEVILDHNRRPRNFRTIDAGRKAEGYNPLCGDRLTVYLRLAGDVIEDVSFQGSGCAISKASARALFDRFQQMITAPVTAVAGDLGKLNVLAGVRQFPVRVKCASLAWHTLRAAADARDDVVSTE